MSITRYYLGPDEEGIWRVEADKAGTFVLYTDHEADKAAAVQAALAKQAEKVKKLEAVADAASALASLFHGEASLIQAEVIERLQENLAKLQEKP